METIRVENLKLSKRSVNGLLRNGIETMDQLLALDEKHLYNLSSLGKKSVSELVGMIELYQFDPSLFMENFLDHDQKSMSQKKSTTVLNDLFPVTLSGASYDLFFLNSHHMYVADLPLDEWKLNSRIKSALRTHGYVSLLQIIQEKKSHLYSLPGIGQKSIESLKDSLKSCTVIKILSPVQVKSRKKLAYLLSKKGENLNLDWIYPLLEDFKEDDYCYTLTLQTKILNHPKFFALLKNSLYTLLFQSECVMSYEKIALCYPQFVSSKPCFVRALDLLVQDGLVLQLSEGYCIQRTSMQQWLLSLPSQKRQILRLRLQGNTLENIAGTVHMTREGVRQIIKRELAGRPRLTLDAWIIWYENYHLDNEALRQIFEMDKDEISFFNLFYQRGSLPVTALLDEEKLDTTYKARVWSYCNHKKIQIGNQFVDKECAALVRALVCLHFGSQTGDNKKLFALYQELMNHYQAESEALLFDNIRAFEARLERFNFLLNKMGHHFRYYPIDEYDIKNLICHLDLPHYKNQEISAAKLFYDHPLLMHEYHLLDEYELHNLLKKSYSEWKDEVDFPIRFGRMPIIILGEAQRSTQVLSLLNHLAPISIDELALAYEQKYGMKALSVKGNAFGCIRLYYDHGIYKIGFKDLDSEEFEQLKKRLSADFYTFSEIEAIYKETFHKETCEAINPKTLRRMGFTVLSDYVISNRYPTAEAYFRSLISSRQVIDCSSMDKKITSLSSFTSLLGQMSANMDLLEIESRKFMTLSAFGECYQPVSKTEIRCFIDDVLEFAGNTEYFTLYSLKKKGFAHPFDHLGLDDWFESALIKNTSRICFSKFGNNILFCSQKRDFTRLDFFTYLLEKYQQISVSMLCELLETEYEIYQSRAKILGVLKSSSCTLYYDSSSDLIFFGQSLFYSACASST